MTLKVIVKAQEVSPNLTLVTYTATTGSSWRVFKPGVAGGPGILVSSASGQALVGTSGAAILSGSSVPSGYSSEELSKAIFAAETERRNGNP